MVENSAPESADEERPESDAGEGEPNDVVETTERRVSDAETEPEDDVGGEPADGDVTNDGADANDDDGTERVDDDVAEAGDDVAEARDDATVGGADAAAAGVASDVAGEVTDEPVGDTADRRFAGVSDSDVPEPDVPEGVSASADAGSEADRAVPEDVQKYARFKKMDGAEYDRVNEFLRERTYVTAREWAIARLCADFRTETGVEMTKIGENLPRLVPFMTDTYTPQAVNQARSSFEEKVNKAGATFLYGAMSGFFTAEELDEMMYEVTEIAKFLLEVEGVDLSVAEELAAEDKISAVMREVRESSARVRGEEVECPECGHVHDPN